MVIFIQSFYEMRIFAIFFNRKRAIIKLMILRRKDLSSGFNSSFRIVVLLSVKQNPWGVGYYPKVFLGFLTSSSISIQNITIFFNILE